MDTKFITTMNPAMYDPKRESPRGKLQRGWRDKQNVGIFIFDRSEILKMMLREDALNKSEMYVEYTESMLCMTQS